jgi:hypothetical protein
MIILFSQIIIKNYYHKQKALLCVEFDMSDMGEIEYYLGIHIKRNWKLHILELNQSKYINDALKRYGMENCQPISTPL